MADTTQVGFGRTIAMANGKGGVGKTASLTALAGMAAATGLNVLIVDLDQQGDVSDDLGLQQATDEGAALREALLSGAPVQPQPTGRENLHVVFGGVALGNLDRLFTDDTDPWQYRLGAALGSLEADYDLILIDCPPGSYVGLTMACVAARYVIIPTRPDSSSIKALRHVAHSFIEVRPMNPDLTLLGVLLFGIETTSTRIRRETRAQVTADLGGSAPVFDTVIRYAVSPARQGRERGRLPHELEEDWEHQEQHSPFWERLRNKLSGSGGADATEEMRLPPSASGLASDYAALTQEIFSAIEAEEAALRKDQP